MRALVLTSSWPDGPDDYRGGFVREWCLALQDQGISCRVLVPRPLEAEVQRGDRLVVESLPGVLPGSGAIFSGRGIEEELRRRPDGLLPMAGTLVSFLLEAIPRCLAADVLVAHWVWPMGLVGAALSRMTGIPLGIVAHSGRPAPARIPGPSRLWGRTLERARSVACVSDAVARDLGRVRPAGVRIEVIPLGVTLGPMASPPESPVLRVLFVGRMIPLKGGDLLLRAVQGMSRVHLTFIGGGPEGPRWRKTAWRLGVDARFCGEVPPEAVGVAMSGADLLVVPSRRTWTGRGEGMPRVILEAWSRGLPVVVSDSGGAGEAVRRHGGGIVVPANDPEAIRQALGELTPERLRRLREEAREAAMAHRWEVLGERWAEWVRSLVARR